ncbi:DUF1212-domain-containing protein [Cylindrobasidium torrendii FP15055 ss-10]|uniref:DUF1212-domain-containing protein n=1 Tax=Cylindrobasidium torrendii FP15055 ss-10 TaxID=1314674 RepID=A0A0D7BEW3_9AGAR|nr:DUF1212-domain-containing protein [Cylindrobasidium torrendii FP15055 ss-10]
MMPHSGGATPSGQKTPRRVQWLDDTRANVEPVHELDELGRDPMALDYFTKALKEHQQETQAVLPLEATTSTSTAPTARIHYFPPQQPAAPSFTIQSSPPVVIPDASTLEPTPITSSIGSHSVPGTYIDPNETAGLPNVTDDQYTQAANIVRAHTRGKARAHGLHLNLHGLRARERSRERVRDEEKDAVNPKLGHGSGVLGALLSLYNDQTIASALPTPIEERAEPSWSSNSKSQAAVSSISTPSSSPGDEKDAFLRRSNSLKSFARSKDRNSSSSAIASLIASTGNISGPAAPKSSQLQPDVKRPGYHLSRYSLEAKLPTIKNPSPPVQERPKSVILDGREFEPPTRPLASSRSTETLSTLVGSQEKQALGSSAKPSHKKKWSGVLGDFPYASSVLSLGRMTPTRSPLNTPSAENDDPFSHHRPADAKERERKKRKKAEIYITRHVAKIMQRQEFILKLARAMMMFGAPSHRLQSQIVATGRVLDVDVSCMVLPDVMLISFDDSSTGTSSIKFIRQASGLDIGKLTDAYELYWAVIHDELSVADATTQLTGLMQKKQIYPWWALVLIGGMCSSSICTVAFNGSFIDAVASWPLGASLVALQLLSVRNEIYSQVFEILITIMFSFIAAAMAASGKLCYPAIAASSVVLILPGLIVLMGALELMSRNIISGSVRMVFAIIYSLFLGYGLSIGAQAYERITQHKIVGITDYTCASTHDANGPWWQQTPSKWWAFLTVPMYSLFLSLRNFAPYKRKEMALLIVFASIGWVTNYFTGKAFSGQSDISALVGAFAVGFLSNLYGKFFDGNAFVIMITGILFQLPSGMSTGGLLGFVSEQSEGLSTSYVSGFQTGMQLVSVAIGLTVGLGLSLLVMHPIPSRRRGAGVFSL